MRKWMCWLLAVVITLVLSVYQRMTGPTNPKRVTVELNGETYRMKLPRSGVQQDETVVLKGIPANVHAQLHYRRYPTSDAYTTVDFKWEDSQWQAALPVQPVAGKLQYYITVDGTDFPVDEPLVIRFRNDVPASILIPHILFMFAAMLFAVYTLLLIITRKEYAKWLKITVATLFVGGFILGPLVQHVAFGLVEVVAIGTRGKPAVGYPALLQEVVGLAGIDPDHAGLLFARRLVKEIELLVDGLQALLHLELGIAHYAGEDALKLSHAHHILFLQFQEITFATEESKCNHIGVQSALFVLHQ